MRHDFFDSHSHGGSQLSQLDPRAKLLVTLGFIVAITALPPDAWWAWLAFFVIALALMVMSKVSIKHYFQSLFLILPLLAMLCLAVPFFKSGTVASEPPGFTHARIVMLGGLVSKTILSYLFSIVLLFSTSFTRLMEAFEKLGVPKLFVMIANFAYRYQFVIVDETERLVRSRNSRLWQPRFITQTKTLGYMIGTLFLRSYERSERVYMAMASRGFDGKFKSYEQMRFSVKDLIYSLACLSLIVIILVWLR